MSILAVDPGLHACGAAVFRDGGELIWCGWPRGQKEGSGPLAWARMSRAVVVDTGLYSPSCLVLEVPQVYGRGAQKGDPNDLIQLAGVLGAICAEYSYCDMVSYAPREWKGQVPKPIMQKRIEMKLRPEERRLLDGQNHNVWDAVGIGLKYLGRL